MEQENTLPDGTEVMVGGHLLTLTEIENEKVWVSKTEHYLKVDALRRLLESKGIPSNWIEVLDAAQNTGNVVVNANPEVNARIQAERGEEDWMAHLAKYGLLNLHHEALEVGYRIRVADGRTFDLEYQAGLPKYAQPPYGLKTFTDDPDGRNAARALLAEVRSDIKRLRGEED